MSINHIDLMKLALIEAEKAGQIGEVPVGAVLAGENMEIISAAHNKTISLNDPTAHAEILVLRKAAEIISNYRLLNTTLYVTVEPCIMCMGAIVHARVKTVVYGAYDLKWGAAGTLYNFADDKRLNHQINLIPGICQDESRNLIQSFFRARRKKSENL
ncbi:MAG: nucleoside deaminase [Desulfobacterales bacterium]|jgi:tRNA(adenine34) deaminase|nr:nucleoside deaminase [Desulfobacteraceae bacterium]MBT4363412.1 nucleoside deaminase [Desulfobacteraceae bacterium]MBT7084731.1 nucleoside deaminase [Desulfobacterales bacterium]